MSPDQEEVGYQPNAFDVVMNALPPGVRTPLVIAVTGLATAMNGADLYFHSNHGISDPTRRDLAENLLGPTFTQHLGNSFFSFAIMTGFMLGAAAARAAGNRLENQRLLDLAHHLPLIGLATVSAINVLIESTVNLNAEGMGDVSFGLISAGSAIILATALFSSIHHARDRQVRPKAKGLGFLANTSTALDDIFPSHPSPFSRIATSADELFT